MRCQGADDIVKWVMVMYGLVFSIEEFSPFDGPGIRSTVFLKGCPLHCSWCHNPEGQSAFSEIVRSPNGCLGCLSCEKYAEVKNDKIIFTEQSIKNCPNGLLRVCGEKISSEALCDKILKNKRVLQNGGVTFSGGEPLMQSEFLIECLSHLKGQLHTAVQTSGFCEISTFRRVADVADMFLYDLKIFDDEQHIKHTGVSNENIKKNFVYLVENKKDFIVRIPLIPTVTDTEENLSAIAKFLEQNGVKYVELLPYNKMAGGKYALVGRAYEPLFDEKIPCNPRTDIFQQYGIRANVL